jgi:hypothetical protein
MATGIRKLHSQGCRTGSGGRCNCGAGYEASVYLAREGRKVRKTFRLEAEARSWRADALVAANRGALRPTRRDPRTLAEALEQYVEGMRNGAVHPKGRVVYKPNTVRSYERAVKRHIGGSALGAIRVGDVRRRDVQAFADELLGHGLEAATVSNVLNPGIYSAGAGHDRRTHWRTGRFSTYRWSSLKPRTALPSQNEDAPP